jgi:dTDP-4-amino-4,6-dideoxygalactose transaminase
MKVPLLDLKPQLAALESELKAAVLRVVDETSYINGPEVAELESAVAAYVGAKHGIGVSSGTDALLVALMALEVGPGDVVLTTPYSFFATAGVIARLGATPAFVDIDPETYNLCPKALAAYLEGDGAGPVKAIIPVHLYGQCVDMDAIRAVASGHDIPIVEDAAQAIGARYPGKEGVAQAGSMGAMGCFSFFPSKNLGGMGDGGMVVTNDDALAERLRKLRNHGAEQNYLHALLGGNFRLDTMQAAVLLVKLQHLDTWHGMRQENAAYYDANLAAAGVKVPALAYGRSEHIYNQYVISVPERRDALREHLNAQEIGDAVYYPVPFHLQPCFANLGYGVGDFPVSEYAAKHTIALPIYPELTQAMQDHVVETITAFFQ